MARRFPVLISAATVIPGLRPTHRSPTRIRSSASLTFIGYTGPHLLPFAYVDRADHPRLQGPDELHPPSGHDPALRHRDGVDAPEPRPPHGKTEQQADEPGGGAPCGRGRCLQHFQRGGEELAFLAVAVHRGKAPLLFECRAHDGHRSSHRQPPPGYPVCIRCRRV